MYVSTFDNNALGGYSGKQSQWRVLVLGLIHHMTSLNFNATSFQGLFVLFVLFVLFIRLIKKLARSAAECSLSF